ncbi:MAG: HlyC/CorC family transporter [Lentisphaeria bacterium]|nr:HlyC/CorC family transporter [Lentisphaeria bacterium]
MNLDIIIAAISFILFLMVFTAFEAFDRLSGGRIMKLEDSEPELAARLNHWLEKSDSIRAVFKLLLFILVSILSVFSLVLVHRWTGGIAREWQLPFIIGAIILYWSIGEIFALLLLYRSDLWVLRITIPWMLLISNTVLLPFTLLSRKLRENAEDWRDEEAPEQIVSSEDEILSLVENYGDHENDDLEEGEKRMIKGILDLGDMSVREIMTPRVDIEAIPASASIAEAKKMFIATGHSRIPIYGRSVDEIKGIIYAKDFIDEKAIAGKTLEQLSHKPLFIPESKEVGDLLEEIRRLHNHFAVIIDEYGGTSGIVTFEDIIEEIVGDVQDEYDNEEIGKDKPKLMPDGSVIFEARTSIAEVNEILDADIPETDTADTIGGYICAELGRIPDEGEKFHFEKNGLSAVILKADKRKILKLKIKGDDEAYEE